MKKESKSRISTKLEAIASESKPIVEKKPGEYKPDKEYRPHELSSNPYTDY